MPFDGTRLIRLLIQCSMVAVCVLVFATCTVASAQSATFSHRPLHSPEGGFLPGRIPHELFSPGLQRSLERNGPSRGLDAETSIRQLRQLTDELTPNLSETQRSLPNVRHSGRSGTSSDLDSWDREFAPTTIPVDQWLPILEQFIDSDVVESWKRTIGARTDNQRSAPVTADRSHRSVPTTNRRRAAGPGNSRTSSSGGAETVRPKNVPANNSPSSNTASRKTNSKGGELRSGVSQQAVVASFIEAIDAVATDWLKAPSNPSRRTRDSWWRTFRQRASRKLSSWNQSVHRRSRDLSRRLASVDVERAAPAVGGSGVFHGTWPGLAAVVLLAAALVGYRFWKGASGSTPHIEHGVLPAAEVSDIRDADTLILACHQLAVRHFGWRSCFWNHRHMFAALTSTLSEQADNMRQLSLIYERARYSSGGHRLSGSQLQRARELFALLWHTSSR